MKERLWLLDNKPSRRTNLEEYYEYVYVCPTCHKKFGSDFKLREKTCWICWIKIRKEEKETSK